MTNPLRMTHQREIILEELKKAETHPTADELYERIKKRLPRISLATVYRNLEILSEADIIKKMEISGRQKRFDWDTREHNHVVCIACNRIDNIELESKLDVPSEGDMKNYQVSGCRVEFYGLCPECQKKTEKNQRSNNHGLL